jgi:pseudaminic acid cytidylyltransferase
MSILAIIPARGGSKRIPRKNVRPFHGKPMIAWSISAALESHVFDEVIVSTDDEEIASFAEDYGASVPFRRPADLSNDFAPTMPVMSHAIRWWEEHRGSVEIACCLQATAPFIRPSILREGLNLLSESPADFVLSVTRFAYPVQRSLKLNSEKMLDFVEPENALKRSQDLEPRFHDAGQFFIGRAGAFFRYQAVLFGKCLPIIVPEDEVVDIDTEEDWRLAEKLFSIRQS